MKWIFLVPIFLSACAVELGSGTDNSAPKISIVGSTFGAGTLEISGAVELPPAANSGRAIRLEILGTGLTIGNAVQGGVVTTTAKEVKFSITELPAGDYKIRMSVDESNDGSFGTIGDYDGWYNGTVTAPLQSIGAAQAVILLSVSQSNVNFGISE